MLFGIISTSYGVGDGSTTFNLPDLRGRVAIGSGTGAGLTARTLAATGGEEGHVLTSGETWKAFDMTTTGGVAAGTGGNTALQLSTYTPGPIVPSGHNTMQPFLVTNYIIKVL